MAAPFVNLMYESNAPVVTGGVAVRSGWFEFDLEVGLLPEGLGNKDFLFGFRFGAFGYSLRHRSFRLRHGILLGMVSTISFKRAVGPFSPFPFPSIDFDLVGFLVRLGNHVWLEIDPFNVGFPLLYEGSLAVRWEL